MQISMFSFTSIFLLISICFNYIKADQTCECGKSNLYRQKRIVGGSIIGKNKYPWIAAILDSENNNQLLCAAAVLTTQHILTAAHCVFGRKVNEINLKIGSISLKQNNKTHDVIEIICHKKFSPSAEDFDIAILTLETPLNDALYRPICFPSTTSDNYNDTKIAGWGKTEFYGNETFNEIRETQLSTVDYDECKRSLMNDGIELTDRIFCAGDYFGKHDSCQGDSGTPLMALKLDKYYIIGISSFGVGCGQANRYGVYTRIDYYIDWIINTIGIKNMTCQQISTTK